LVDSAEKSVAAFGLSAHLPLGRCFIAVPSILLATRELFGARRALTLVLIAVILAPFAVWLEHLLRTELQQKM
jgi:hypothetical protein